MSIRKRTWETKDGPKEAWVVDYKDQAGKRRLKTFDRQKDAKAWWEGQASYEIKQGTHTPESASITVAEAAQNWLRKANLEGREASPNVRLQIRKQTSTDGPKSPSTSPKLDTLCCPAGFDADR